MKKQIFTNVYLMLALVLLAPINAFAITAEEAQQRVTDNVPLLVGFTPAARRAFNSIKEAGDLAVGPINATLTQLLSQEAAIGAIITARIPVSITPQEGQDLEKLGSQQTHLVNLLGRIGVVAGVPSVLAVARSSDPRANIHQNIIRALSSIGPNTAALDYALEVLADNNSGTMEVRGALAYLADEKPPARAALAQQFLQSTYPAEVRDMAAYLAGNINQTSLVPDIDAYLNSAESSHWKLYALYGLAKLVTTTQFNATVSAASYRAKDFQSAQQYSTFIHASDADKRTMLQSMLNNEYAPLRMEAFLYIMAQQDRMALLEQYRLVPKQAAREGIDNQLANADIIGPIENHIFETPYVMFFRRAGYSISGTAAVLQITGP